MGLIPFDMDMSVWIKDMTQGLNAMKPLPDPSTNEE
jgi:hypothetical protein